MTILARKTKLKRDLYVTKYALADLFQPDTAKEEMNAGSDYRGQIHPKREL